MPHSEHPFVNFSIGDRNVSAHEVVIPPYSQKMMYYLQELMQNAQKKVFSFEPLVLTIPRLFGFNHQIKYPQGALFFEHSMTNNLHKITAHIFPRKITYLSDINNSKSIGGLEIVFKKTDYFYLTFLPPHADYVPAPYSIPLPSDIPRRTWTQLITTCVDAMEQPSHYRVRIISDGANHSTNIFTQDM